MAKLSAAACCASGCRLSWLALVMAGRCGRKVIFAPPQQLHSWYQSYMRCTAYTRCTACVMLHVAWANVQ